MKSIKTGCGFPLGRLHPVFSCVGQSNIDRLVRKRWICIPYRRIRTLEKDSCEIIRSRGERNEIHPPPQRFYTAKRYFTHPQGWISLKNALALASAFFWWGKVDSNHRRHCQQIYSLSPLATREFPHIKLRCQTRWSWWTDSNPRPADYKSAALPAELHQHGINDDA